MLFATEWSDTETSIPVQVFGVAFTTDARHDEELDILIGKAIAIKRALHYSVVVIRELSKKSKALNFWNSLSRFSPTVSLYGHENLVMTERVRSQVQASKMSFFPKNQRSYIIDKVRSSEIRKSLNIEPLLLRIERSRLRWFDLVSKMPRAKTSKQALLAKANGKKKNSCTT